jgi:hypothetical protein
MDPKTKIKLKKLEKKFAKNAKRLKKYDEHGSSRKLHLKYKSKAIEVRYMIYKILTAELERHHEEFRKIAKLNYDLLSQESLSFKTHKTRFSKTGNQALTLRGRIQNNGLLYCKTSETNMFFDSPFSRHKFPSVFQGKIDCLGQIVIHAVESELRPFQTIPELFNSTIEPTGRITIKTLKTEKDIIFNGKTVIEVIAANPFGSDKTKQAEFFSNKEKLIEILEVERKKFIK